MFDSPAAASIAADVILVVHAAFIAFVVFGQIYVLLGWRMRWCSARNRLFRRLHLAAIGVVVIQAWIGFRCPLTSLEAGLRTGAGEGSYEQSFVAHWLSRLIYYDLPPWVFVLVYSLFGALVLLCYRRFPPRPARQNSGAKTTHA